MQLTFKQRFGKHVKWFAIIFFAMLAFRLIYGYLSPGSKFGLDYADDFFSGLNVRKNYASEKKYYKEAPGQPPSLGSSQKYEKTATVKSKSSQFEKDAALIKTTTKNYEGIIQYEQVTGNKGKRETHLLIGINPEKFDSFYLQIQSIGTVKSTDITKVDKTNEYRELNAKKTSLEKTLASLNELKSRGGVISDYIALHDKILEIESQMQELGVELGNFDTENEFCTIRFSLYEGATEKNITFTERLKVAFEWTIKYYALLLFSFMVFLIVLFLLLLIADKLKMMQAIDKKLNE